MADVSDSQPLRPGGGVWFGGNDQPAPQHWWLSSVSKPQVSVTNSANCRYWYDLAGNLASSKLDEVVTEYRYNAQNKLTKVEHPDATYIFAYDSQNRRIGLKKDAGRWTQRDPIDYQDSVNLYVFCGNGPWLATDELGTEDYWVVHRAPV